MVFVSTLSEIITRIYLKVTYGMKFSIDLFNLEYVSVLLAVLLTLLVTTVYIILKVFPPCCFALYPAYSVTFSIVPINFQF